MSEDRLLLQSEVAERLRCGDTTVKRLRMTGKLAYIPGRPVKIRESDLAAYIEAETVRAERLPVTKPPATRPQDVSAVEAAARAWALNAVLFRRQPRTPRTPQK